MTEAEWLACDDPTTMTTWLEEAVPDLSDARKVILFGCACCRAVWDLLPAQCCRDAIELQEWASEGLIDPGERNTYLEPITELVESLCSGARPVRKRALDINTSALAVLWLHHDPFRSSWELRKCDNLDSPTQRRHLSYLRDIFGNPFRPVALDPAWRTANVVGIAQSIYEERAFDRLPILADALEDAGCTNADMLNHCRQPGDHVRGCWPVDLVLGKK